MAVGGVGGRVVGPKADDGWVFLASKIRVGLDVGVCVCVCGDDG